LDDTVAFSISKLCHWSHLKSNYHDGKINHKYLEDLELLSLWIFWILSNYWKVRQNNYSQCVL